MAKKQLMLVIASILVLTLFLGVTSAITFTDSVTEITLNQNTYTNNFTLSTDSNATFSLPTQQTIVDSNGNIVYLDFLNVAGTNLAAMKYVVNATGAINSFDFPESGFVNVEFTANNMSNSTLNVTKTIKFIFENTNFCEACENPGNLEVQINDIQVIEGFGDDDSYWYPLDEIEVEVDIDNNGNWDMRKIEIEWALYNTDGKEIMTETEDDFKLDKNDDTTITFTFIIDEDIDKFEGEDAILYVKAKGEIDDNDANALDGEDSCDSDSIEVEMNTRDDFVFATEFEVNGVEVEDIFYSSLLCGQEVTIAGNVWNIGDNDQDEVTLVIYNKALGIYMNVEFDEVQAFESESFSFSFTVPQELEEKNYQISFEVFDEDDDLFETSEDDKAETYLIAKVEGICEIAEPLISAVLDSEEVKAGNEMMIKAAITNPGEEQMILSLDFSEIEGWATVVSIDPVAVILGAGETKEVTIVFKLDKDSEGEHTFNILALENNEIVQSGTLFVTVEESSFNLKNLLNKFDTKLALIILVNLILIIAIIVVAVRISRRK